MTERTPEIVERLYKLYEQHFSRLQRDIAETNLSLGSSNPKKTNLKRRTIAQFEAVLTDPTKDEEATQLWVRRITRGHDIGFLVSQAAG